MENIQSSVAQAAAPVHKQEMIVVARGRFGAGYVVVHGYNQLQRELAQHGVAKVRRERSKEEFSVRRTPAGDIIDAEASTNA
jgi:hypothetical protein